MVHDWYQKEEEKLKDIFILRTEEMENKIEKLEKEKKCLSMENKNLKSENEKLRQQEVDKGMTRASTSCCTSFYFCRNR